ncbi:MAG: KpsF/GutQ family sugar-phosphate isomerase [Rickettsiales bacterium]|jgi:arabinose-5-phosphate isomerase|nr:KpsF/GutQ family sugar-phosphate isomerase [Rickettsiales bacterium]
MFLSFIHSLNNNKIAIESGKRAIEAEINGLQSILKKSIDDRFAELINIILRTRGRVFLSGVGKPSYVAMKTAAGFSSTGTPAFFIHPGEASHGDLGMVTREDIVILLSNSGGSMELNDIIAYSKRIGIKLISITRKAESFVSQSSDLPIVLEDCPQTNPVGSPTTDTIMFQSYLDAVLTVLIELKKFDNLKFKVFHPGGKLGSALIRIKEIMRTDSFIPIINVHKTMPELLKEMNDKALGCCIIVDNNNKLLGIVTDGDLRRKTIEYGDITRRAIEDIMTRNPKFIRPGALAVEAVASMTERDKYRQVLIVADDNNKVVGVVHIQDLFKARII